ncbi:unnamed protein product [Amoebophrya sp. A25]|nr:unnamed protein product [Amoebophrya sp. A25]|eukprot:GSA25T00024880001.1
MHSAGELGRTPSAPSSTRRRQSIAFPSVVVDKKKVNNFLVQAVQAGDLDQITALVLEDGADLESKDRLGRPLTVVANLSELLMPHQKDDCMRLLQELPGRLATQLEGDTFSGLKMNTNATKHKHCHRNRTVISTFAEQIDRGTMSTTQMKRSASDLAQHATLKNPDLLKIPQEQYRKTLPTWTRGVGGEPTTNALSRSGNLLYSDPTLIQENAGAWGQLLGSREVALYYMSRSPNLLQLNQQRRSKCWQALQDVLKTKPLVFWVMHQSCVPQRLEVLGRSTYGSSFQGTYSRIDGCRINDKVVYVKDEIIPPKPKIGAPGGPAGTEQPSSGSSSPGKKKKQSPDAAPEIKIPSTVMYLLLDEQQKWQITPTREPVSKIPLKRVEPTVIRDLGKVDSRAILDPSQLYVEHYPWELRQGGGKFAEDRKLKVLPLGEGKHFTASPLFYLTPELIRCSYGILKEMLGPLWVVNDRTIPQYEVCPDLRKKDLAFTEEDSEAGEMLAFKKLGAFSGAKNFIYLRPNQYRPDGLPLEETVCEMVLWDPVTVYLLFFRTGLAEEDQLTTEVPWLAEWTEELGMMLPRVDQWKGGRFRVFTKSFPRGTAKIPGSGLGVRPPLIYGRTGAYGYSVPLSRGLLVNYSQKLGDPAFCITDPSYDPVAIAARDQELEDNPEEPPALEDEEEQKTAMAEWQARQVEHLHPGDYQLLMLGSFDAFNDYTYLQLVYEDVANTESGTDVSQFTLQVAKPVTVFLCYMTEKIPEDVRVWHVTERWKSDERLKPPIIRNRKTRHDHQAVLIKTKDFPAGEIKIKSSQGALLVAFFKPIPARNAEEDDVDPAKRELTTRPTLFSSYEKVYELFNRLREEFGDDAARRYLQRSEITTGYQLSGQWISRLGRVNTWVRELKLEHIEEFRILAREEVERACERFPEILRATGPHLTAAFQAMVQEDVFGGHKQLRSALQKSPPLLQVEARVIKRANHLIKDVFEEESSVLFEAHPDLLQLGDAIETLFNKLYAMFPLEFVRHRLKQSVKESNLWQQWYKMLRRSNAEQDEWIGRLQPYEDQKAVQSQTGKMKW